MKGGCMPRADIYEGHTWLRKILIEYWGRLECLRSPGLSPELELTGSHVFFLFVISAWADLGHGKRF